MCKKYQRNKYCLCECYDNHLYSESDINDIVKDTSKEIELTNYIEEKDYDYL